MLVILKGNDGIQSDGEPLVIGQTIFSRPTPWKIAWLAFLNFLFARQKQYQFVFIPREFRCLCRYEIDCEDQELTLWQRRTELYRTRILEMSWGLWWEYAFQSHLYGLFWKFWEWRWDTGKLTREELQTKLEVLEERLDQLARKRTSRIEQEK